MLGGLQKTATGMKVLNGWKEIAVYLQSGVRTVQRWERQEGLPVVRHRHNKRGSVSAVPLRIDRWLERRNLAVADRIRGELGKQIEILHRLTQRQRALAKELREVATRSHEIRIHLEQQFIRDKK